MEENCQKEAGTIRRPPVGDKTRVLTRIMRRKLARDMLSLVFTGRLQEAWETVNERALLSGDENADQGEATSHCHFQLEGNWLCEKNAPCLV